MTLPCFLATCVDTCGFVTRCAWWLFCMNVGWGVFWGGSRNTKWSHRRGDLEKWCLREVVTLGSGDSGEWWLREVVNRCNFYCHCVCESFSVSKLAVGQSLRSVKASVYKSFKLLCKFSIAICRTCRAMVVRTKFFWEVYCVCMVVQSGTREQ